MAFWGCFSGGCFSFARQRSRQGWMSRRIRGFLSLGRWSATGSTIAAVMATGTALFAQVQGHSPEENPASAEHPLNVPKVVTETLQTIIRVTDYANRPIPQGTVHLSGDTQAGAYFDQKIAIQNGIAVVPLKSDRVDQMTFAISSPGYLTHLRKFSRGQHRFLQVAPKYSFDLMAGITIGGKVVSPAGTPVPRAHVHAYCPASGSIDDGIDTFEQHVSTDDDGIWEMLGAPKGLERLTLRISDGIGSSAPPGRRIRGGVAPADPFPEIEILPADHAKLTSQTDVRTLAVTPITQGAVVDPTGKPVVGALVLFAGRNFYRDHDQIPRTNAYGKFPMPTPNDGAMVLTVFSLDWALQTVKVTFPLKEPVKIVLQKGRRVAFRTLNPQGQPIAGIRFFPEPPRLAQFEGNKDLNYLYVLDYLGHRDLLKSTSDENGDFAWENAPTERLGYQITSSKFLSQPGGDFGPSDSLHVLYFRPIIPLEITIVDDRTGQPVQEYKVFQGTHFKQNPADTWSWNFERPLKANPPGRYPVALRCLDRTIQYRIEADGYLPALTPVYDAKELPDSPISVEVRMKTSEK